jgi:CheY-like chemotaxis protein/HPt (histidine-containing phosphotransfer) domain-containing protein
MNAIMGMSHLALKTDLDAKQYDYVQKIDSSAKALLGIINDILDVSKIEAGKMTMEATEFPLDEVLGNLSTLLAAKTAEKGLEFLFRTGPDVPNVLIGDPLRLGQILINLANNAVKFTERGEIVLSTELVEKSADRAILKFAVQDTGIGLSEEQAAKLFQPFSQADTSTTRKYGGTGLGLTICKSLVELMRGEIRVESELGQGSIFTFTAHFGCPPSVAQRPYRLSSDLMGLRTLVVDDNASSRDIFRDYLESFGIAVSLADSGSKALRMLEAAPADKPFELVLMDWQMPGQDGVETSRRIKQHKGLRHIPAIIMVTAFGREEIIHQTERLGLEGLLIKPVSPSVLFNAIMEAFGREAEATALPPKATGRVDESVARMRGARILLAEDNDINQQIAREILESAGLEVIVANDGRQAVAKIREQDFNAVLMDIQMPVMDGYAATREIRRLPSDKRHIPIIAMTAHAMSGDREKSLAAGMNDHVTKPIDPPALFQALVQWIGPLAGNLPGPAAATVGLKEDAGAFPADLPGIDTARGLARVGGNARLYRTLLTKFRRDYADVAHQVQNALEGNEQELARRLAHTVKGVAGNVGAEALQKAAGDLERAIRQGAFEDASTLNRPFAAALQQVLTSLERVAGEETDAAPKGERRAPQEALALLKNLAPCIEKRKPKPCRQAMEAIHQLAWPEEWARSIRTLDQLIGGYRFKEALQVLQAVIEKCESETA